MMSLSKFAGVGCRNRLVVLRILSSGHAVAVGARFRGIMGLGGAAINFLGASFLVQSWPRCG